MFEILSARPVRARWSTPKLIAPGAFAFVIFISVFGCTSSAQAYAWMIRHEETQCANCHADPSGGGLLTRYGRLAGYDLMRMSYGNKSGQANPSPDTPEASATAAPVKPPTGFMWGLWDTPRWLLLGGSLRLAGFAQNNVRVFPMQLDAYGQLKFGRFRAAGSIGVARIPQNSNNGRDAFVTTTQGNGYNMLSRTHWLALDLGKHRDWVLRGGRLNVPFGLRIPAHYAWIRDITRTDTDADQQTGMALAYTRGSVRTEWMAIAGNYQIRPDRYRERGYSGYFEYIISDRVGLGISSLLTSAKSDRVSFEQLKTLRGAHGVFMRARIAKPLVVMAEADVTHISRRSLGYVGFVQLDLEPVQGLHFMATVELLDRGLHSTGPGGIPYMPLPGDGQPRLGGWLTINWFLYSQLNLRADLIARQDTGAVGLIQLHAYL